MAASRRGPSPSSPPSRLRWPPRISTATASWISRSPRIRIRTIASTSCAASATEPSRSRPPIRSGAFLCSWATSTKMGCSTSWPRARPRRPSESCSVRAAEPSRLRTSSESGGSPTPASPPTSTATATSICSRPVTTFACRCCWGSAMARSCRPPPGSRESSRHRSSPATSTATVLPTARPPTSIRSRAASQFSGASSSRRSRHRRRCRRSSTARRG